MGSWRRVGLAVVLVTAPLQALADPAGGYGYGGHMWDGGMSFGMGITGVGVMILVWGAIVVLAVLAVQWLSGGAKGHLRHQDALDILRERLARGDIDPAEYSERKKALEG